MMNIFRKIAIALVFIIIIAPLAATDTLEGRTLSSITFEGLVNVKEKTASSLVSPFIGRSFDDGLYSELDSLLYSQDWLSWMMVDATMEGDDGLALSITVYENPLIESVSVIGNERLSTKTVLESQNLEKGAFYSTNNAGANAHLIEDAYRAKGYRDAKVTAVVAEKDEFSVLIDYRVEEGLQYKVKAVLFEGISGIGRDELKKFLTTKVKSFFDNGNFIESTMAEDRSAILAAYATRGYPDAKITKSEIVPLYEESDDRTLYVDILYTIDEGAYFTIGTVSVKGNSIYPDSVILPLVTIEEGARYNIESIQNVYISIASLYYDNGYVYSYVNPVITRRDGNRMDITFEISEGTQTKVEEIRITGLTKTKPYVLERELAVKTGEVFSRSDFIQSQQNMYNTALLKNITASLYPGRTEDGVICEFEVEEGNQMELQFGATFGATELNGFPISGFLSLTNNNLGGTGRALSLSTELSPTTQSLSLSLSDKWVGDRRWSNGISFSFQRNVRSGILQRGIGSGYYDGRDTKGETYPLGYDNPYDWYAVASQTYPQASKLMDYDYYTFNTGYSTGYTWVLPGGNLSVSGGVSVGLNRAVYDSSRFDPYEILITRYNEKWQFSNKLSASVTWDGRNHVDYIPHGYVLSASYTYAGGILSGLSNYNRIALNASAYRGVAKLGKQENGKLKDLILGISSEVDLMLPQFWNNGGWGWFDPKQGATKYEMLYLDGMNMGRGFSVVFDQAFLWNNQVDLTYPLVEDVLSAEAFVSATGLRSNLSELTGWSAINWYLAGGAGIKMEIPGFPLGLYLVKNARITEGTGWQWMKGNLFSSSKEGSGLSLVLAITTSIY